MKMRPGCAIQTLVMLAGTMAAAGAANGAVLSWNNPAGGSAGVGSNWNPVQIPLAGDILNFNVAAAYEVGFPASVPASSQQNFNFGDVSVTAFAPHAISGQMVVALSAMSNSSVDLTGTFTVGGVLAVGGNATGTGSLTLVDDNTLVTSTSSFGVRVGNTGGGTMTLQDGARLVVNGGPVRVGSLAGSDGDLFVTGATPGGVRSELLLNHPTAGDLVVGDAGVGAASILDGGLITVADHVLVGTTAGVSGELIVGSAGPLASVLTAPTMIVGGNTLLGTAAGVGSLAVQPGAEITAGSVTVGDPDGGAGALTLTGGLLTTGSLAVLPGSGVLRHLGGEIHVTGSYTKTTDGPYFLPDSPAAATPAVLRFTGATVDLAGGFQIGSRSLGNGHMMVLGGSVVTTSNTGGSQRHVLGGNALGTGALTIIGAASRLNLHASAAAVSFGVLGDASITMEGGLIDSFQPIRTATEPGSTCTITMSGAARIRSSGEVVFGGAFGQAGGMSTATISDGSTLECRTFQLHSSSSLTLDDAVLTAGPDSLVNTVDLRGAVTLANGAEIAGEVVNISGTLTGSGNVYGDVTILPGGLIGAGSGDLFVGSIANATTGFVNLGTLAVNAGTVHILDGDASAAGAITIAGGNLFAEELTFAPGSSLSGHGGIHAAVNASGAMMTASGAALVFNGPVQADATCTWTSGGTPGAVSFAAGGGFTGAGVIGVPVTSEEEASIVADGDLTLGVDENAAVVLNGPLQVGAHTVSLRSNTSAFLGVMTTLDGGTLVGPASNPRTVTINIPNGPDLVFNVLDSVPLVLPASQTLEGSGVIDGQLRSDSGSQVTLTGALTCKGSSAPTPPVNPIPTGNTFVRWMGDLDIGAHDMTFTVFPHRFEPESVVTIAGGSIHADELALRGELTGHGRLSAVSGPIVNIGHLHPGGSSVGELRFEGGFANGSSAITLFGEGTLHADISGDQGFPCDRVVVEHGDAILRGSLVVTLLEAEPPFGQAYTIVECENGFVVGTFDSVTLPALSNGTLEVRYTADRVQIVARPACLADFNADGNVDPDDLGDYINCFFSIPPCGQADFNADGNVDPDDLGDFINVFFGQPC
ncbi:MAG: hypothetical protein AB7K52_13890 [Phycisphaerales bacterium]